VTRLCRSNASSLRSNYVTVVIETHDCGARIYSNACGGLHLLALAAANWELGAKRVSLFKGDEVHRATRPEGWFFRIFSMFARTRSHGPRMQTYRNK